MLSIPTSSLVAGFGEEVESRGFLQAPLERRYGPFVAILATGTLIGVMHASHSGWSVLHLPVYLSMSAFLGAIARRTGSILPCIALHASLDPVCLAWMRRRDLPLVGGALCTGGADRWFVTFVVGGCAAAAATVAAYRSGMHTEAARPVGGPNDGATA
ncbi:MAG: CPBP family intramembrane glutamic endopeptidase [Thermoanaerobaculia bacterium]